MFRLIQDAHNNDNKSITVTHYYNLVNYFPPLSVSCSWGYWSEWSECLGICGLWGNQTRERKIANHAAYGGSNCSGNGAEIERCRLNKLCPSKCLHMATLNVRTYIKFNSYIIVKISATFADY